MADTGDTGTNLANTIRVLKKFDGSNPDGFKARIKKFCFVTAPSAGTSYLSAEGRRETNRYCRDCGLQEGQ